MSKKQITGGDVREVWDWRLSHAQPINFNSGETWVCKIIANDPNDPFWAAFPNAEIQELPGGNKRLVIDVYDTGIPTVKNGVRDIHDREATRACHEWAYSVRGAYSRDHIEDLKPLVAMINGANADAQRINDERSAAIQAGDQRLANEKSGKYVSHLNMANREIKKFAAEVNAKIGGAS